MIGRGDLRKGGKKQDSKTGFSALTGATEGRESASDCEGWLDHEHAVAVREEAVTFFDGLGVGFHDQFMARKG